MEVLYQTREAEVIKAAEDATRWLSQAPESKKALVVGFINGMEAQAAISLQHKA